MKKVILVTGPRATLKTTVCNRLQSDLGIMVYNFEEIKQVVVGLEKEALAQKSKYFGSITINLLDKLIARALAVHEHVILEMTYLDAYYFHFVDFCKKRDFDLITVFMTGDPDVIYERYAIRAKYAVQRGDEVKVLDELEFFDSMIPIPESYDHSHILDVDTTTFDDQDYTILMHRIIDQLEWKSNNPIL